MNQPADYPRIRQSLCCPFCEEGKGTNQVCCWVCFGRSGFQYGNPKATARLDRIELAMSPKCGECGEPIALPWDERYCHTCEGTVGTGCIGTHVRECADGVYLRTHSTGDY